MKSVLALLPTLAMGEVLIQSVSLSGAGCGTYAGPLIAPGGKAFVVGFDEFIVSTDTPLKRTCTVAINLQYPIGCTKVQHLLTHHVGGYVEAGVTGSLKDAFTISRGTVTPASPAAFSYDEALLGPSGPGSGSHSISQSSQVTAANSGQQIVTLTSVVDLNLVAPAGKEGVAGLDTISFNLGAESAC
ncbi:hypothetical protein QBC35DRAFT_503779 [Podospora australis]|uniref:Uncharacterized protein n=1 Tax=Podospora australis TaxID=1536484 RepID=A0AAN6WNL5_9PEZI|nr:hypothetical protein QBC35DRAFT_503779 [Podospora australis]